MASSITPRSCWDSCLFIAIIAEEEGRVDNCLGLWREATVERRVDIYTSAITIAECADAAGNDEREAKLQAFLQSKQLKVVNADRLVSERARAIQRQVYSDTGKKLPVRDSIHLATAIQINATVLYTYDRNDLIRLDGRFANRDGLNIRIAEPSTPPNQTRLI